MALDVKTSWRSPVYSEYDESSRKITLRAEMRGTVETSAGETSERIRTSGEIPQAGQSVYPDNINLVCVAADVNPLGPILFEWTARYHWETPETVSGGDGGLPGGWSRRRATRKSQTQIDRDVIGNPIMTITDESPNPPLNDEICDAVWVFQNTLQRPSNEDLLSMFDDAVNDEPFLGKPQGVCKIEDIQATENHRPNQPPELDVQVTVVVGKPPPAENLWELGSNGEWRRATRPATYYTWHKRWRAEGLKYRPFATGAVRSRPLIDVNGPGETAIPQNHYPDTGLLTQSTAPQFTHWYTHQTKVFLPFRLLFGSF